RTWSSGRPSSLALQRPGDLAEAATEEVEGRRILHGGFGARGLLRRHLTGVVLEAGPHGDAVLYRGVRPRFVVDAAQVRLESRVEVDVARLVPRRRGVRDIGAEHTEAL